MAGAHRRVRQLRGGQAHRIAAAGHSQHRRRDCRAGQRIQRPGDPAAAAGRRREGGGATGPAGWCPYLSQPDRPSGRWRAAAAGGALCRCRAAAGLWRAGFHEADAQPLSDGALPPVGDGARGGSRVAECR